MTIEEAIAILRQIETDIARMRASIDQLEAAFVDLLAANATSPTNPPTLGRS